ncbi:MAG: hypothetical protein RL141_1053 [Candidatus Parcubacteria bacterium]
MHILFVIVFLFVVGCATTATQPAESPAPAPVAKQSPPLVLCGMDWACLERGGTNSECQYPAGCTPISAIPSGDDTHILDSPPPCSKEPAIESSYENSGLQLVGDVQEREGFHVVGVEIDPRGERFVHVADTCQHYFCSINMPCVEAGGSEVKCMNSLGCTLVHAK